MSVSKGESSVTLSDILEKTTEANILSFYLGVTKIPCIIHSPLRKDNKPSFGLYSPNGKRIYFVDFATRIEEVYLTSFAKCGDAATGKS